MLYQLAKRGDPRREQQDFRKKYAFPARREKEDFLARGTELVSALPYGENQLTLHC